MTDLLALGPGSFQIFDNDHGNGFVAAGTSGISTSSQSHEVSSAVIDDFNQDRRADLAIITTQKVLLILLQEEDGSYSNPVEYFQPSNNTDPTYITSGDFNADGAPDLALANSPSPGMGGIVLNKGDGTFPSEYGGTFSSGSQMAGLATDDFNADGRTDLTLIDVTSYARVLLNTTGSPFIPGDTNRDGAVDFKDLVVVAQNYGKSGKDWTSGDVTGDHLVSFADLVAVAQHYTSAPPAPSSPVFSPAVSAAMHTSPAKTIRPTPVLPPKRPAAPIHLPEISKPFASKPKARARMISELFA
jgi:hypothetical protein